jgi:hypothetical protein
MEWGRMAGIFFGERLLFLCEFVKNYLSNEKKSGEIWLKGVKMSLGFIGLG